MITVMLCALIVNTSTVNANNKLATITNTCDCCKNCKDDKCKERCTKWAGMTEDQRKSEEGKKLKSECAKACKESKCDMDGKSSKCDEKKEGKSCCKKK